MIIDHNLTLMDTVHLCPMWFVNAVKGYVIYSIRRKLKKQYAHLKGSQIMKLKQSGTEVSSLELAYSSLGIFLVCYWPHDLILDYGYHTVPGSCLHRRYKFWFYSWPKKCRCPESKGSHNWGIVFAPLVFLWLGCSLFHLKAHLKCALIVLAQE